MKDSLLIDTTFERFNEMEKVSKNMEGLYDLHDGKAFILDKSQWTRDYMNLLMVEVLYNFSHERIAHLKDVVRYLYPLPNASSDSKPTPGKEEAAKRTQEVLSNIIKDLKSLKIKISFSNDFLKGYRLNKDNKSEFKKLVMEEIKKQLKINNEANNIFS